MYQRQACYRDRHEQCRHPACNLSYTLSHPLSICEKEEIETQPSRIYLQKRRNRTQENGQNQKMIAGDVTPYLYQCVSLKQWTRLMVLSIDSCMRCGGLTKRFLKHRYDLSLVLSQLAK